MSTTVPARGSTWRLVAVLLGGLAILLLVPHLLYRASVLPIRVTFESHDNPTATLLPNGNVIVIGNSDRSDIERYDPRRDRWQRIGSLNHWLLMHTATLLVDGRILVAGEEFDAPDFFQIYDPMVGTWSEATHWPHPFYQHTATLLHDGTVLFTGGTQNGSSVASRYDPATNQWLPAAPMASPRTGHTATLLRDGRVLVVGGSNSYGGTTAEIYDPVADCWRTTTSPQAGHGRFTASPLADGRVLIAGGNEQGTSEVYDPVTDTWQLVGALATPRYGHTATSLADGQVLVVGGQPAHSALTTRKAFDGLDSAERFDPSTSQWVTVGKLDRPRNGHAATSLPDGRVLVVDGYNSIYGGSTEQFDPRTGRWGMAGGITVSSFWGLFVFLPLFLVAFGLVNLVAILFDRTRWGRWWCASLQLHKLALPLPRRARISLLSMYGAHLLLALQLLVHPLRNSSLWPYQYSHFPLIGILLVLYIVCFGTFLFTRKALTPPAALSSSPSAT